jgi:hypothetical protein
LIVSGFGFEVDPEEAGRKPGAAAVPERVFPECAGIADHRDRHEPGKSARGEVIT